MGQENIEAVGIGARLRAVIDEKFGTIRAFSEQSGLSYRTLQQYLHGERMPGSEIVLRVCAGMSINAHWLLTGQGPRDIEPGSLVVREDGVVVAVTRARIGMACNAPLVAQVPVTGAGPADAEQLEEQLRVAEARAAAAESALSAAHLQVARMQKRSEGQQLAQELNLEELLLMASRSTQGAQWGILLALDANGPLSFNELSARLESMGQHVNFHELLADLAILEHSGQVEEIDDHGEIRYRIGVRPSVLYGRAHDDSSQLGAETLRWLITQLLPSAQRHEGYISHMVARVARNQQRTLQQRIRDSVVELVNEAELESSQVADADSMPFHVLLGIKGINTPTEVRK